MPADTPIRELTLRARFGSLAVVFFARGDRFGHRIEFGTGDGESSALESVESWADGDWPRSPPFQHVQPHSSESLVCVGMAGSGHWSASIDRRSEMDVLCFDIACRLQKSPAFLGSTYASDGPIVQVGESTFAVRGCRSSLRITAVRDPATTIYGTDHELVITPIGRISSYPVTARWRYEVRIQDSRDGA
jgi:hypothetical protein